MLALATMDATLDSVVLHGTSRLQFMKRNPLSLQNRHGGIKIVCTLDFTMLDHTRHACSAKKDSRNSCITMRTSQIKWIEIII